MGGEITTEINQSTKNKSFVNAVYIYGALNCKNKIFDASKCVISDTPTVKCTFWTKNKMSKERGELLFGSGAAFYVSNSTHISIYVANASRSLWSRLLEPPQTQLKIL